MANSEHVNIARQGATAINTWKKQNPGAHLDLSGANLQEINLCGSNLSFDNLYQANLCHANIHGANLREASLGDANLKGVRGAAQCRYLYHPQLTSRSCFNIHSYPINFFIALRSSAQRFTAAEILVSISARESNTLFAVSLRISSKNLSGGLSSGE